MNIPSDSSDVDLLLRRVNKVIHATVGQPGQAIVDVMKCCKLENVNQNNINSRELGLKLKVYKEGILTSAPLPFD